MNGCDFGDHLWKLNGKGEWECQDCPELGLEDDDANGNDRIIINSNGIDIDVKDGEDAFKLKINEDGVKIKAEDSRDSVNINLNAKGVKIDSNND